MIIEQHNTKILNSDINANPVSCNCGKKIERLLNVSYSVVYKATVNTLNDKNIYIGMTENTLKQDLITTNSPLSTENIRTRPHFPPIYGT